MSFSPALNRLADAFRRLPGIGPKTALRLTYYILSLPEGEAEEIARALTEARRR
ncbi:MAG TPA: recombination protein RecR, partial [Firmicutes bacterium]|nr:recombination protein RecR [Bacillota bacterium]